MKYQIILRELTDTEERFSSQIYAKDGNIMKDQFFEVIPIDTGSNSRRHNKKFLLGFMEKMGVPKGKRQRALKDLGFWYSNLGGQK